ncbi:MAG: hypothetical protein ALAOOOJD_00074 [bacterium]|nr:hypothetical protein [bacterium]
MRKIFLLLLPCGLPILTFGQTRIVDFKFAPANYLTAICLVDDWQKTLVSEKGALAYDFGPGPYAKPLTEISVGIKEKPLAVTRQHLRDPRIPIVTTEYGGAMQQQAFALIPEKLPLQTPSVINEKVQRLGGLNGCIGWAAPTGKVDPALRNVAWGTNRPIKYRVKVLPGSKKRVALGICESYKPRPGTRIIELHVEGATPLTVDPMASGEKNHPYVFLFDGKDVDGDGQLAIEAHASPQSPDPNVILNAFWVFPENTSVTSEEVLRGEASARAEVYFDCGTELEAAAPFPRLDGIMATFADSTVTPIITIRSPRVLAFDSAAGILRTNNLPYVLSRPRPLACKNVGEQWQLELPPGTKHVELIVIHGNQKRATIHTAPNLPQQIQRAKEYWQNAAPIPRNKISVPDSGIQFLLDANLRNMYQVRENLAGHIQFHPGPTVYRGLWLADVILTGIPVAMLGDTSSMRQFLENGRQYQLPNGQLRVMYPTVSLIETSTFIYSLCWFAQSTNNKAWLQKHWPAVTRGMEWIRKMREQTLADPGATFYGLMPPGFVDGGISTPTADYGSLWWAMIGLEKGIEAAHWLGQRELAAAWQKVFDAFLDSFNRTARRDLRQDRHGNIFLPISVADTSTLMPQKGQYAFLLPLRYAKFFQQHNALLDSIVVGNMAMLEATTKQGLITSSGWLNNGVWPWLGGIHGIAQELYGQHDRAHDLLYAYANHAAPAGTWVEEQQMKDVGTATTGDVSNAEASAIFIHFVRILLVRERLNDLELLAGVPHHWLVPKAQIAVNEVWTDFGPVTLRLTISPDGKSAAFFVSPIDGRGSKGQPIVFLAGLKKLGFVAANGEALPDKLSGVWGKPIQIDFKRINQDDFH